MSAAPDRQEPTGQLSVLDRRMDTNCERYEMARFCCAKTQENAKRSYCWHRLE